MLILLPVAVLMVACGNKGQQTQTHEHEHDMSKVKKVIGAQVFIKPEKVVDFLAVTDDLVTKSRAEAGNISYTLYQDPKDNTKFFVFEEWKDQAAIDFHFATEHFQNFGKTLNECAASPAVITIYDCPSQKNG